ncbi:MAG: tRNA lysidine(34) synthetase TilS [Gammaproteobacteria bacterium]|nr:MAG: tRNA lysidine(34) synthetase TilS [Gammaproteobacteria bacterium]
MDLTPDTLRQQLWQCPAADQIKTWWLAYSGGADSQVLLFLLSQLDGLDVRAVYIDHGLQAASRDWARHCEQSCRQLGIPFQSWIVDARAKPGESPEAAARHARYTRLAQLIGEQDCLLTAQHEDDQSETLLLQLVRGAGAAGLAAMPMVTRFSRGWHVRPMLGFSRQQILDFARQYQLKWIEDPSNQNERYDRNYLRKRILPLLRQRWPSVGHSLSRAAELQAENAELLDLLAAQDCEVALSAEGSLTVAPLLLLDETRQRNLLRFWIRHRGFSLPSRAILQQIQQQMLHAREDACPMIHWADTEVHRYQGRLYLLSAGHHDPHQVFSWDSRQPLKIASIGQQLCMQPSVHGIASEYLDQNLMVRFRKGGETIRPAGRGQSHRLKKLLQEAGVPPWQRDRIPLLYREGELIAVVGFWIAEGFKAVNDRTGMMPVLLTPDSHESV